MRDTFISQMNFLFHQPIYFIPYLNQSLLGLTTLQKLLLVVIHELVGKLSNEEMIQLEQGMSNLLKK